MERSPIQGQRDRERRQSPLRPSLSLSRVSVSPPQIPLRCIWATSLRLFLTCSLLYFARPVVTEDRSCRRL